MTQEIVWLSTQDDVRPGLLGGKGNGLLQLTKLGLPVPPGFVLTTNFFATKNLPQIAAEQNDLIQAAYAQLEEQLNIKNPAVAVRSSALAEDGQLHSFAGAFNTFLWVRGLADIADKICQCHNSLFSARANGYRAEMALTDEETAVPQMAIIIQAMIPAQAAGVMMTLNPSNGDRSKIAIESTWGLGRLLVDGTINPDRFLVDKITGEIIEQTIANKTKKLEATGTDRSGTAVAPVPHHLADLPSLTKEEIEELCGYGRLLETHFGIPQDIEFATYQNQIFILQARPETAWAQKQTKVYGLNGRPIDHIVNTLTSFGKTKPHHK